MNVQDRRRLLGPANAKPIAFSAYVPTDNSENQKDAHSHEPEQVTLSTGLIENCNGSSLVEFKDYQNSFHQTSLITSVYGPRAIKGSFTSQAVLSIQLKNGSLEKYDTSELKEVASFLTSVFNSVVNLSRYPKSGIDIFIYLTYDKELSFDESKKSFISAIIPYCITGITLALTNAGIEIVDLASAGYHSGDVFSFIKNGEEVIGYWKDDGDAENITESLALCKEQYLHYKVLMTNHLIQEASK